MKVNLPWLKKTSDSYVGVSLCKTHPSIVEFHAGKITNNVDFSGAEAMADLSTWITEQAKNNSQCCLVLQASDYELLLVESVDVPDDELADALSFKVKDLLPWPLEETSLQAFRLPTDAYRGRMTMAYVVAVKKTLLYEQLEWARGLNLDVIAITVPEMSLLNVFARCEKEGSIAVLSLGMEKGEIHLYKEGALYLTRSIEMGLHKLQELSSAAEGELTATQGNPIEDLELEIQRSLDYYESQLGMGAVSQVYLLTHQPLEQSLLETLQQKLPYNIEQPELNEWFDSQEMTMQSAMALGGALRYVEN